MKVKVNTTFPYAHDGINAAVLHAGDEAEINENHIQGLVNAGYISSAEVEKKVIEGAPEKGPATHGLNGGDTEIPDDNGKLTDEHKFAGVDIPDDWENLSWSELKALGSSLSDDTVHNKAEATAAVDAEIVRRDDFQKQAEVFRDKAVNEKAGN